MKRSCDNMGTLPNLQNTPCRFDQANPREPKHYDLLIFLYSELGQKNDQLRITAAMNDAFSN